MSFLGDYFLATSNNESPPTYHRWCGLSALAAIAGRRFWFRLGPFTYYPNFYVVLVGDPGVKKSAAMDVAKDLVRKVGKIPMAASSTTKEAIATEMGHEKYPGKKFFTNPVSGMMEEYNQLAIFATEFTTFLGVNPTGMLDFLTSIYTESVYDERYKNKGSTLFVGPFITMLACMTPETVKGYLKLNILTGGFSRRTMFVYGARGRPNPWPGNTPEQQAAMKRCIEFGKDVQTLAGEFVLSEDGAEWYEEWYMKNAHALPDRRPNIQNYFSTKHEFLFKTAMLVALSERHGDKLDNQITAANLEFLNSRFFSPVEEVLERVFEGAGINPNASAAAQVCRMLEALDKPMPLKHIHAIFFDQVTSLSDLKDTLQHLIAVGRLSSRDVTANGQLLGTIIGTPAALLRTTDVEAALVLRAPLPQPRKVLDQTGGDGQPPPSVLQSFG
jgi:hypothetical protein